MAKAIQEVGYVIEQVLDPGYYFPDCGYRYQWYCRLVTIP